jgi:hypothetical protein
MRKEKPMVTSANKSIFIVLALLLANLSMKAQTPVVYKELNIDPDHCLQINNFEVIHDLEKLKGIPMKYNAPCEAIEFGKINFAKKSLVVCSQYVRNGETAITTTKLEVLRNDREKRIDIYFATFGSTMIQRPGKVFENRKWLLLPKFPSNYKVNVLYSLKVVKP